MGKCAIQRATTSDTRAAGDERYARPAFRSKALIKTERRIAHMSPLGSVPHVRARLTHLFKAQFTFTLGPSVPITPPEIQWIPSVRPVVRHEHDNRIAKLTARPQRCNDAAYLPVERADHRGVDFHPPLFELSDVRG